MPSSTAGKQLPYPLGTDRLMDGDDAIRKLAQSVDNMVQVARLTIPITAAGTAATIQWNFPVAYTSTPFVLATPIGGTGAIQNQLSAGIASIAANNAVIAGVRQVGTSGFDVFVMAVGPVAAVA